MAGMIGYALVWVGGAASTVVAAWMKNWLSAKTHSYFGDRTSHRDDLRRRVLETLRIAVENRYTIFDHSVDWKGKQYNAFASSREAPTTFGLVLTCIDPAPAVEAALDEALFDDARTTHYPELIASWNGFKTAWVEQYLRPHLQFIQTVSTKILNESGLPEHPTPDFTGPYVMQLSLATLIYDRLMLQGDGALAIKKELDDFVLCYNNASVAKGSKAKMEELIELVDKAIDENRALADDLKRAEERILEKRASLLRELSLAIASNKLRGRCSLIRFL